jgi:hypothetical protein
MNITHHPSCATQPELEKLAVRSLFASGLCMAVMGLTMATATADPTPPNTPGPTPPPTAAQHPPTHGSESGLCNGDSRPANQPPPLGC